MVSDHSLEVEEFVILKALDSALKVRGFTRMGGADKQGEITFQDYRPQNVKEINDYWQNVIELLLKNDGKEILIRRFSDQVHSGNRMAMIQAIVQIIEKDQIMDNGLRQQLDVFLNDTKAAPEIVEKFNFLIDSYAQRTTREKLQYFVVSPPYLRSKDEKGVIQNKSEERMIDLAIKLLESGSDEWLNDIDALLQDEQRMSFTFGRTIGSKKENWEQLVNTVIAKLAKIPFDKQNTSFLEGYAAATTDQSFIRWTIDQLLKEKTIAHQAIKLSRFLTLEMDDLDKLYPLIEQNPRLSIMMESFGVGQMKEDELRQFFEKLKGILPYGPWVAFEIVTHNTNEKSVSIALIRDLLLVPGMLKSDGIYSPLSFYGYIECLKRLTQEGGLDENLVIFLSNEILKASEEISVDEFHLKEIVDILFSNSWEISWPIIATRFQDSDFWGWYNLKSILRYYRDYDFETLISWMGMYPDQAPQKIIEIVDWTVSENGTSTLSPLVMQMLNNYGNNKDMLSHFSNMLHSFSWSGSLIPLLESRIAILIPLLENANPDIQLFAQQNINYFKEHINREQKNELNEGLYYD